MSNCETCKEKKAPATIPYVVYEAEMTRNEMLGRRLWITILVLIFLLVGSNCAWLWWSNQWETVETRIEAEQGDGVNIVGGGDITYGAESENDYPQARP